jgi:hypothetical protein
MWHMAQNRSRHMASFLLPYGVIFGGTDFCLITRQVTLQDAMRTLLVLLSMISSHPAIATGHAGTFVSPVVRSGISHKADLIASESDLPG